MNKKYLIYLGIGMVLIVGYLMFMSAEQTSSWCYQETANVSTVCGGLDSGSYIWEHDWSSVDLIYDENWSTSGNHNRFIESYDDGTIYINYSKPINSTSTSIWQIKYNSVSPITSNFSIPINCWNQEPLQIRVNSSYIVTTFGTGADCWDGTVWDNFYANTGAQLGYSYIYEEAMYWNITTETPTVILPSLHISLTGTNNHLKLSGTNNRLNIRNQTA